MYKLPVLLRSERERENEKDSISKDLGINAKPVNLFQYFNIIYPVLCLFSPFAT